MCFKKSPGPQGSLMRAQVWEPFFCVWLLHSLSWKERVSTFLTRLRVFCGLSFEARWSTLVSLCSICSGPWTKHFYPLFGEPRCPPKKRRKCCPSWGYYCFMRPRKLTLESRDLGRGRIWGRQQFSGFSGNWHVEQVPLLQKGGLHFLILHVPLMLKSDF